MDIATRSRIMNSIRRYLSNSVGCVDCIFLFCIHIDMSTHSQTEVPFAFEWAWARVIAGMAAKPPCHAAVAAGSVCAGEEEGVYGWLTVNKARGTLFAHPHETTGAIDLGGASSQITFSPIHTSVIEVRCMGGLFLCLETPTNHHLLPCAELLRDSSWRQNCSSLFSLFPWIRLE